MNYENFKSELYRIIMQQGEVKGKKVMLLEKGFTSGDDQVQSMIRYTNRLSYGQEDNMVQADCIYVIWGEGSIRSMMQWSVREFYCRFQKEGWEGILPELLSKIQDVGHSMDWLCLEKGGYEKCRDRLIIRAINYMNNRYELENCIYHRYGEIALTLYAIISDGEHDYVTMKITKDLVREWQVSKEQLLNNAMLNTMKLMPPRLFYCTDLKRTHEAWEGAFLEEELKEYPDCTPFQIHRENELEGSLGYRLSTTKGLNGAVAFFYPGVQKRLSEMMEGSYLVGFTSIHEAVIHPDRHQSAGNIRESIKDINDIFPKEEMLSNEVYHYYAPNDLLVME